jgi:hypothetical protein
MMMASFAEFNGKTPERIVAGESLPPQRASGHNQPFFIIGRGARARIRRALIPYPVPILSPLSGGERGRARNRNQETETLMRDQ